MIAPGSGWLLLDRRSLRLFRVGLSATLLLEQLDILLTGDFEAFYVGGGLSIPPMAGTRDAERWSILRLDDNSRRLAYGMEAAYVGALLMLLVGRHTVWASAAAFMCCASQQGWARESAGMYGVAVHALFWSILLPVQRHPTRPSTTGDWLHAVGALGLRTQLFCMYVVAAYIKHRSLAWTQHLDALQRFVQWPYLNRGLPGTGAWLLWHEGVAHLLTRVTPPLEVLLTLLLVLPAPRPLHGPLRALVLPPLFGLHVGIKLVLGAGVLPLLNASVLLAFVPAAAWESRAAWWCERQLTTRRWCSSTQSRPVTARTSELFADTHADEAALLSSPTARPDTADGRGEAVADRSRCCNLLRQAGVTMTCACALWLMAAIVWANANFVRLTARPPPPALSLALWVTNMPQGPEFAAFGDPPGVVECWELPAFTTDGTPLDLRPLLSTSRPAAALTEALARGRSEHPFPCAATDLRSVRWLNYVSMALHRLLLAHGRAVKAAAGPGRATGLVSSSSSRRNRSKGDCKELGPWSCTEAGCPSSQVACRDLRTACNMRFSEVWSGALPDASLRDLHVWQACGATCGRCGSPVRGPLVLQPKLAAFVRWACGRADAAMATAVASRHGRLANFSVVLRALDNHHVAPVGPSRPTGWAGLPLLPELPAEGARHEFLCSTRGDKPPGV